MAYDNDEPSAPATTTKLSKKDEREVLTLLEEYFEQALDDSAWKEHREEAVKCFDYKENRQWTKAELQDLAARGQPPTVNNQVKVTIDRIVGQFVQVKTKTVFKPRNGEHDQPGADGMTDVYNYIRQSSGLEYEERDAVEDGATGGFGCLEVAIEGDEVIVKAEDCFAVLPDPRFRRYDWNEDARYIIRYKWVDEAYLKELYPKKKAAIGNLFTDGGVVELANVDALRGETYLDYKRNRVRLIECQYKKREDGDEHLCIGVFTKGILFEHGKSKRKRFSFVPYMADRKKNGAPYSRIWTALSMQDAINKRESKALALLTLNQATYEEGAIGNMTKEELSVQMAKPDGIIPLEEGYFERFKLDKNLELAQSQNLMHQQAKADFRSITGINPDALGEKSEMRSGIGVQRKVAMTGLVIAPMFDNFKRTREALAKTIHDAVAVAYTPGKVMTITDNAESVRSVTLDNQSLDFIKQSQYDLIISEEADYDTVQEQQQEMLAKNLPLMLQFGTGWGKILFEMSSLRNKAELLEKVKQIEMENQKPQEVNVSFSAAVDKMTLPEKIFHYQKLGMPPELLQMLMQEAVPPTQVLQHQGNSQADEMKAQAEVQKTQMGMQTEELKAKTAREKGEMDIKKAVIDIQIKQMELELKQREMEMKLQLQRESAQMDMQGQQMEIAGKQQMMQQEAAHDERAMQQEEVHAERAAQREDQQADKAAQRDERMMKVESTHKTGLMREKTKQAKQQTAARRNSERS
jgi:hypothetical protein